MCGFLAIAALFFGAHASEATERSKADMPTEPLPKPILRLAFLILCLYVLVGGMLDNLYFFDEAFGQIPNFMFYILLYAVVIDIAAGFAFERMNAAAVIICAFVLICVGQSMSFFSQNALLVYPYTLFSNAGNMVMEIFLISLPVAYCAYSQRKPGILPGLGYILLYGSFFLMDILFEYIPEGVYRHLLGVVLLISIAAIMITIYLIHKSNSHQLKRLEDEFSEKLAQASLGLNGLPLETLIETYGLTKRETEVLQFLIEGKSTSEIAGVMSITVRSVQNYVNVLMSKTGTNSRGKMIAMFTRPNP
jgi:DNA-binding CsgD family transcriptional regulator